MLNSKTLQTRISTDIPLEKIQANQSKTYEHELFQLSYQVDRHPHNILSYKRIKNGKKTKEGGDKAQKNEEKQVCTIDGFLRDDHVASLSNKDGHLKQGECSIQGDREQKWKNLDPKKWKNVTQQKLRMRTQSRQRRREAKTKIHSMEKDLKSIQSKTIPTLPNKERSAQEMQSTIEDQHLMNWLNQVLTDYCFQGPVKDSSFKALERFGLDKSTLLSQGISMQTIGLLYRSLFSHSLGFQTSLKEVSHNKLTMKSIWKAYAILLQYCSAGYFETMMGELQRDMIKNEQRLMEQIERRQKIIDNGEEEMDKKLGRYERENKELKKENKELREKKQQLQNDFREIEMGYNMEVSLRLSYEHKINKVYSVHQRLNLLHQNLFRDFKATDELNKNISSQSSKLKHKNIEMSIDYQQALKEMAQLQSIIHSKESIIEGLKMNEQQLQEKISSISQVKKEEVFEMKEKERKVSQLQQELKSSNLVISILKGSANSQLEEYKRISEENVTLRKLKQEHFQKIDELLAEIIHLNSKESRLKSELAYSQKEMQKVKEETNEVRGENQKLKENLQSLEIEIKAKDLEIQSLKKTIESFENNIKQLKTLYENTVDQCKIQKRYSSEIKLQMEELRDRKMELEVLIKNIQEGKFEAELQLNRKVKELLTLKKQQETENNSQRKKYDSLYDVWATQDQSIADLQSQLLQSKTSLEEAVTRISFLSQQYTDLSFEKAKLMALYTNNLVLHDNEKKSQKNLMISVSQLSQKNHDAERQLAKVVKLQQQKELGWERDKQRLTLMVKQLKEKVMQREEYIPAIYLQDALSMVQRERGRYQQLKSKVEGEKEKESEKESVLKLEFQKRELELKGQLIDYQKRSQQTTTQLQHQLQYEKHKIADLKASSQMLEVRLKSQTLQVQMKVEKQTSERVEVLMKQKNNQIKELYSELERIEDNFTKKTYEYQSQINTLKSENIELQTLKQQKQELHERMIQLEEQHLELMAEKERAIEAMKSAKKGVEYGKGEIRREDFAKKLEMVTKYYHR